MDKITLHLEPHCSPCWNFLKGNTELKRTVWVAPVSIREDSKRTKIAWSCSAGRECECLTCLYARAEAFHDDREFSGMVKASD